MPHPDLELNTAERLLRGAVSPEDASPEYRHVAELFQELVPHPGPLAQDDAAVAALAEIIRANPAPPPASGRKRHARFARGKIAFAGLAGAVSLTTGLAAANALPGPAQAAASNVLGTVGVNVPHGGSDTDPAGRHAPGSSTSPPVAPSASQSPTNKGSEISNLARTTDATGADHGATVSGAASDGKSRAEERGPAQDSAKSSTSTTPTTDPAGAADNHGQATSSAAHDSHGGNPNAGQGGPPTSGGPPASLPAQASNPHRP